jgi:TRAP-type C4-dicarboxylate transport system permease small subunit
MARLHRIVTALARGLAMVGGAVLLALVIITCLSILGREIAKFAHADWVVSGLPALSQWLIDAGIGAIPGSFELVEAGMAFCIFAFLPICTLTAGHASVDIFTKGLPRRINMGLTLVIAVLFAVVLVVIALQLEEGMARKLRSGQTTLRLEFPVWWAYAAALAGATVSALVGVYVALLRGYELLTGRVVAADALGAEH